MANFPSLLAMTFKKPIQNSVIQLFRERLAAKMCTRQPRKVIWDMINTLFLTTVAVEPTFVAFHWHSPTYVRCLSYHPFKFLWRTGQTKPPTIPFGIVACTFSDNLSRNSCIQHPRIVNRLDLPPNPVKRRTTAQWTHATTTSPTLFSIE